MKIFISWSGDISHKVAVVFRDWIPSVIQSIEPYVSSEDIDKGARWSTDIAKELENSNFGILCVTKENINAPWLSFEAGALSKTMDKSFVSPFLFDIKRSEVNGPILQFQSTIFQKEDIEKLLGTINRSCGEVSIPEARLKKAFDVWYPTLEEELNKIKEEPTTNEEDPIKEPLPAEILEEILDLSRNNQKLLRNPDSKIYESLDEIKQDLGAFISQNDRRYDMLAKRNNKMMSPMFIEELLSFSNRGVNNNYYPILILLSFFKDDFPWVYDSGRELITLLKSKNIDIDERQIAIREFRDMIEFSFNHPVMRERYVGRKDYRMFLGEMTYTLEKILSESF